MASQDNLDRVYMECAMAISKLSRAIRKKVGSIIEVDGILLPGFNGTPCGFNNEAEYSKVSCEHNWIPRMQYNDVYCMKCELSSAHLKCNTNEPLPQKAYQRVTKPECVHAEANSIAKAANSTMTTKGGTLYTTLVPCFECAKLIIQAGIKRVVYGEDYPYGGHVGPSRPIGLDLLQEAGIQVNRLSIGSYHNDDGLTMQNEGRFHTGNPEDHWRQ